MTIPVAGEYRDRSTGLIVFGILEILMGALGWLFVPLMLIGLAVARAHSGAMAPPPRAMVPAMAVYAAGGTVLVWLGIGSVLARRWARALWVCLSGVGLAMGVLVVPFVGYAMVSHPAPMAEGGGPGALAVAPLVRMLTFIFMGFIYLIIPGTIFLFYRSPHVKQTCEAKDPRERWTDRCPLPLLALCLFTAFGGASVLLLTSFLAVFPVFGVVTTGATAVALMVGYAAIMLYAAWGMYRLKLGAWRLFMVLMVLVTLSGMVTALWHPAMEELYLKAGFNPRMAAQAGAVAEELRWVTLVWFLPWLGWAWYVRRYFSKPAATAPTA